MWNIIHHNLDTFIPTGTNRNCEKVKELRVLQGIIHWPETLAHHVMFTHIIIKNSPVCYLEFHFICFITQYCSVLCVSHIIFTLYRSSTILLRMKEKTWHREVKAVQLLSEKYLVWCPAFSTMWQHVEIFPRFPSFKMRNPYLKTDSHAALSYTALWWVLPR